MYVCMYVRLVTVLESLRESCPQLVAFRRCDGFGLDSAVCACA